MSKKLEINKLNSFNLHMPNDLNNKIIKKPGPDVTSVYVSSGTEAIVMRSLLTHMNYDDSIDGWRKLAEILAIDKYKLAENDHEIAMNEKHGISISNIAWYKIAEMLASEKFKIDDNNGRPLFWNLDNLGYLVDRVNELKAAKPRLSITQICGVLAKDPDWIKFIGNKAVNTALSLKKQYEIGLNQWPQKKQASEKSP